MRKRLGTWLAALHLAGSVGSGCTIEGACDDRTVPTCVSEDVVRTCIEGTLVDLGCADVCSEGLGCTACVPGTLACGAAGVEVCRGDGSGFEASGACAEDERCIDGLGCRACAPGESVCSGDEVLACREDGSGFELVATCDPSGGEVCRDGYERCIPDASLCELVARERGHLGCEFWSAPLASCGTPLDRSFALLLGNPFPIPSRVTFERNGRPAASEQVIPPMGTAVIHLPCVSTPREPGVYAYSAVRRGGAYHVRASTPVSVVELQPTEDPTVFVDDFLQLGDGVLAMPARSLDCFEDAPCEFYAMSTTTWLSYQGSLAIVGTDDRPVTVAVRLAAPIAPSIDGFTGRLDSIPLAFAGDDLTFTLYPGDVVELLTSVPASGFFFNTFHDLTGTRILADGSVTVLSGNELGFVPVGAGNPNTLSESVPPTSVWGTEHVIARPRALSDEPYVVKVLAVVADTDVSFLPEIYPTRRLRRGESFEMYAEGDLVVRASQPVLVAHLTVGESLYTPSASASGRGGPSMAVVPPIDRGSRDVSFASLPSVSNELAVAGLATAEITLDGRPIRLVPIEGSVYGASRVAVGRGEHRLRSSTPIVGWLHGIGRNGAFLVPLETSYPAGVE